MLETALATPLPNSAAFSLDKVILPLTVLLSEVLTDILLLGELLLSLNKTDKL